MANYKKMSDKWFEWRFGDKEKLNEGVKRVNQKTRFGTIEIVHAENPTAPGYDPEYVIDVKIGGNYLASILIEGDPRDNPYNANVKVQTHKKKIKIKK
jgi:hypothetical protein